MKQDQVKVQLQQVSKQFMSMRVPLFLLLVVVVYAFVAWRISVLQNVQPSSSSVSAQIQTTTHIDQATIDKIQQLQNSSPNVNALFNQARQNPFQE
jgi:uncharacterized membrane protein